MNCCGNCAHFTHNNLHGFVCNRTMRPAGYLHVKPCFEPKTMKETTTPQTKVCKKCGRELPAEAFGRHALTKDGLQPTCRECRSAARKGKPIRKGQTLGDVLKACQEDKGIRDELEKHLPPPVPIDNSVALANIDETELLDELRRRGYEGTLTKKQVITL